MKVLALNSSPRVGGSSKTELFLDLLIQGMKEGGASVELVNLKEKKIKDCVGCFSCFCTTPGQCILKDDMSREILPSYLNCDLAVLASPLYFWTVNAPMKRFIDRTITVMEPFIHFEGGRSSHPYRYKTPPVAVLSVAGFQELSVFDQLSSYMNHTFPDKVVAEIYRTVSEIFFGPRPGHKIEAIYEATVQGGKELVMDSRISSKTSAAIQKPIGDNDRYAPFSNMVWQTCIDEGVTLGTFQKNNMAPRPQNTKEFMELMKISFNKQKSKNNDFSAQFEFTGKVKEHCFLSVENGCYNFSNDRKDAPQLVIRTPFDTWMDLITRKAKPEQLFDGEKISLEGDTEVLKKIAEVFSG